MAVKEPTFIVSKPFKSVNRRFAANQPITPDDIDPGSAFSFQDWMARGFIASAAPKNSKPVGDDNKAPASAS
jgi:hypothetical protein